MAMPICMVILIWLCFVWFTVFFFRDPTPQVPAAEGIIVAPAHGKVDLIDETDEPEVLGGRCRRISIFLSVFDVHVQNAPVAGIVNVVCHSPGKFLNAIKSASAMQNENLLIGIRPLDEPEGRIAVRLIAGMIARRIVAWVQPGDEVARGDRIGLIQFGSRCELYLPSKFQVLVKPGDKVVGGETVIAAREMSAPPNAKASTQSQAALPS
jgi:phosphatidylserine decarboxylase